MKHPKRNTRKALKRIVSSLISCLVVIMIVAACYFMYCNISGKVAFVGKYATVKIITPSMEPTISVGTYILTEKVGAEEVREGDVILFYSKDPAIYGKINTHRVVQILTDDNGMHSFITRGDHNPVNDAYPVNEKDLIGRYVKNADHLTAFVGLFANPFVFLGAVILPAAALVVFSVIDVVKKYKEARMKKLIEDEVKRLQENADRNHEEKEPTDDV